jgi:hypothetical protein
MDQFRGLFLLKEVHVPLELSAPYLSFSLMESKIESLKLGFFSSEWSYLFEMFAGHKLVRGLVVACALIVAPEGNSNSGAVGTARTLYVNALGAVRTAICDTKEVREDATLVALLLLASFEVSNHTRDRLHTCLPQVTAIQLARSRPFGWMEGSCTRDKLSSGAPRHQPDTNQARTDYLPKSKRYRRKPFALFIYTLADPPHRSTPHSADTWKLLRS